MPETEQEQKKFIRMTTAPIPKLICSLAVPTILSMMVTSFYNMADTFFVGKLGKAATGAVGVVFSLMAMIQALGFFFGHGSGNFISRKLGARRFEEASAMASTGFFSAFFFGCLLAVFGLIFLDPLTNLLGATPTIFPYARDYLRIILFGAPFMTSSLVLNNQLRYQGSAVYGMVGIVSGAVINIGLDPLFIFTFQMGTAGAALATILSQIVSFTLLLIGSARGSSLRISIRKVSLKFHTYVEIARGGLPSLCRQGLGAAAVVCLNLAAGPYGDQAIAAMSVVAKITNFAASALLGFGQGFQPVCGFNYGAKRYDRVIRAFWFCVKVSSLFLVVVSALGIVFAQPLVAVFQSDPEVVEIGTLALRLQWASFPLFSFITLTNMMLQTMGKAAKASLLAMARQGLFFLPALWILTASLGLFGLQLSQTVADVLTFLLALPLGLSTLKRLSAAQRAASPDARTDPGSEAACADVNASVTNRESAPHEEDSAQKSDEFSQKF